VGGRAHTGLDHAPRRTVRDYERLPAHHETYIYWSMIIVMTRRLARTPGPARTQLQPQPAYPRGVVSV
jgi:hypothetical protein